MIKKYKFLLKIFRFPSAVILEIRRVLWNQIYALMLIKYIKKVIKTNFPTLEYTHKLIPNRGAVRIFKLNLISGFFFQRKTQNVPAPGWQEPNYGTSSRWYLPAPHLNGGKKVPRIFGSMGEVKG